jgi:hypothetical protein
VLAIIGFLTASVVARYRDFDSTTVLRNLAYEIALSVREAQVMTISSSNLGGGAVFQTQGQNSYGLVFNANGQTYTIFNDLNNDNDYDAPGELVKLITISQGASITTISENLSTGSTNAITSATVTFDRPHLDTAFETSSNATNVVELSINAQSKRGGTKTIQITKSGRISVR